MAGHVNAESTPTGGSTLIAEPLVALAAVNKWFGALHVLRDIDLEVRAGEVVVVIGPSGSGKSTEPANTLNDENIIVLGDLEETSPQAEAAQQHVATFALAEIDRIITNLAEPV